MSGEANPEVIPFVLKSLSRASVRSIQAWAPEAKVQDMVFEYRSTRSGGLFATTAFAGENDGALDLKGFVGDTEVGLFLLFRLTDGVLAITAETIQPAALGPFEWRVRLAVGNSGVQTDAPAEVAACMRRSLGVVVDRFLPLFANGRREFLERVVENSGEMAARVVECLYGRPAGYSG